MRRKVCGSLRRSASSDRNPDESTSFPELTRAVWTVPVLGGLSEFSLSLCCGKCCNSHRALESLITSESCICVNKQGGSRRYPALLYDVCRVLVFVFSCSFLTRLSAPCGKELCALVSLMAHSTMPCTQWALNKC